MNCINDFVLELREILEEMKNNSRLNSNKKGFGLTDNFTINQEISYIDEILKALYNNNLSQLNVNKSKSNKNELTTILKEAKEMIKVAKKIKYDNYNIDLTIDRALEAKKTISDRISMVSDTLNDYINQIVELKQRWNKSFIIP